MNRHIRLLICLILGTTLLNGCGPSKSARHKKFVQIAIWEDQATLHGGDLLQYLRDRDVEVRRRAALAIARVGDTLAASSLAEALDDRDTLVRAYCGLALGYLGHKPIKPAIYQRLIKEDNGLVLEYLLWAIGRLYGQEYGDSLMIFLSHPDPQVRAQAAMTMYMMVHRPAGPAVAELFDDPDATVRCRALMAIIYLEPEKQGPPLAAKLDDPDPEIRGLAALALGSAEDTIRHARLVSLLKDSDRWVRLFAAQALGSMRDSAHLPALYPYLETETDPGVLSQLVEGVGWHWQSGSAPYLKPLMHHPDVGVRIKVVTALLRSLRQDALPALTQMADDPCWGVRALIPQQLEFAAKAPGGRSDDAVALMKRLARDSVAAVRASVIKSSLSLGQVMHDEVVAAVNDPDELVRFYALSILPFAGGRVSFDTLLAWYQQHQQDPRPDVRMAILALTGNLSPSIQVGDIQRTIFNLGLTDPDRLVRQYAAAVWLKFREDHRDMVGIFDSPINEATYGEYYREYPALPRVRFVTERGEFIAELYGTEAPRSVRHFLSLVRSGFYDDTPVGLNDNGRTIYIGDRRGDSWGLSLETVRDEVTPRRNERGSLFMQVEHRHDARSLFGVCLGAQPGADFGRTVFGKIVEGVDVIDRLRPLDRIEKVEIISPEVAAR